MKDSIIIPVGLKEALKVRGITKPPGFESWLLKPLQKFCFRVLKKHHVFKASTTPLTADILHKAISHIDMKKGMRFLSGDYDNATNNMLKRYTKVAIESIVEKLELPPNYGRLAIRSLVENFLYYKFKYKGETTEILEKQEEAQPMGKILSFTVLCIINFALCRKAVEIDFGRKFLIKKFPGLINGDDCCFPTKDPEVWEGVTSTVGLFNSIGKTFIHEKFIEMNSRTFIVEYNKDDYPFIKGKLSKLDKDIFHKFKDRLPLSYKTLRERFYKVKNLSEVPFINFGLMKGLVRSESTEVEKTHTSFRVIAEACTRMGWCHHQLTSFPEYWKYDELTFLFRKYHNKYLESPELKGIPYFVPQWLGGLGLRPRRANNQITDRQREVAKWIYQSYDKFNVQQLTLQKTCIINNLIEKSIEKLQQLFKVDAIPPFTNLLSEEDQLFNIEEENTKVYNMMLELQWRDNEIQEFFTEIDPNFISISEKLAIKKINHNRRLWLKGYACASNEEKLPWHKMWHQKQKRVLPIIVRDIDVHNRLAQHERL
jgi:hypothetical protein